MTAVVTLCVAIATFILQEGITNIIHGIIFRTFSKIKIGDRIEILVDGTTYTGILAKQTIRHIVVNDIQTNAEIIIPNNKIDSAVIKNSYNGRKKHNKYVIELPVRYSDAENPATSSFIKLMIQETINECPLTTNQEPYIFVNYKDYYIGYTFYIETDTIENNFKACSWIREHLMQSLASNNIHIPYTTISLDTSQLKRNN